MSDRIIPSLVPGSGASSRIPKTGHHPGAPHPDGGESEREGQFQGPRELDLRRTEAPDPGGLPIVRTRHLRRYGVAVFDDKGRISDQVLFTVLGWAPGTRVDLAVHDGAALVVRHDRRGGHALTKRGKIAVPAGLRRWCGFGEHEQVLLVAVPSLSALVMHGQEKLDRALPDARRIVSQAHPPGERPPIPTSPSGTRSRSGLAGGPPPAGGGDGG